jgi:hypothetical protein
MTLLNTIAHNAARLFCLKGYLKFKSGLKEIRLHQRRVLRNILTFVAGTSSARRFGLTGDEDADALRRKVPITHYKDWQALVERQMATAGHCLSTSPCNRYQPTSGSTSHIKWIPYTRLFLSQIDTFISPMVYRLYRDFKGIRKGTHYWSLSWMPTELRNSTDTDVNDDLKLMPFWKRSFLALTMAVPNQVAYAPTSEDAMFATVCYLAADQRLSLMSIWSPTFALGMFDFMGEHRRELADVLRQGHWRRRQNAISLLDCPHSAYAADMLEQWDGNNDASFFDQLWPNLAVISAWNTATSKIWAEELQTLFPNTAIDGKGLLATEGAVTFSLGGSYPLAYQSHFFEFLDLATRKIYYAWELKRGQIVQPILTTGSGLLRYQLNDEIEVTGFMGQCPCFVFLGRMDGVDLVGEKMNQQISRQVLRKVSDKFPVKPLSLIAIPSSYSNAPPRYLLLCEGRGNPETHVATFVEQELSTSFHYKLAREVGQLAPAACIIRRNAKQYCEYRAAARNMVAGNLKMEDLVLWNCDLPEDFKKKLST